MVDLVVVVGLVVVVDLLVVVVVADLVLVAGLVVAADLAAVGAVLGEVLANLPPKKEVGSERAVFGCPNKLSKFINPDCINSTDGWRVVVSEFEGPLNVLAPLGSRKSSKKGLKSKTCFVSVEKETT